MGNISYFMEYLHFGATDKHCGADHFFSLAQYTGSHGINFNLSSNTTHVPTVQGRNFGLI
jgi:hypothetical protein